MRDQSHCLSAIATLICIAYVSVPLIDTGVCLSLHEPWQRYLFWNDVSGLVLCSLSSFSIVAWVVVLLANCFYYMVINAHWFSLMLGLVHLSFALASFVLVATNTITTTNVFLFQVSCVHALVFGAAFMQSVQYNTLCTCPMHVPFHNIISTVTD